MARSQLGTAVHSAKLNRPKGQTPFNVKSGRKDWSVRSEYLTSAIKAHPRFEDKG